MKRWKNAGAEWQVYRMQRTSRHDTRGMLLYKLSWKPCRTTTRKRQHQRAQIKGDTLGYLEEEVVIKLEKKRAHTSWFAFHQPPLQYDSGKMSKMNWEYALSTKNVTNLQNQFDAWQLAATEQQLEGKWHGQHGQGERVQTVAGCRGCHLQDITKGEREDVEEWERH